MLTFKIKRIIAYAYQHEADLRKAISDFFEDIDPLGFDETTTNRLSALFNEYLAFEYRNNRGTTFAAEYCLKNPDDRPPGEMEELKQIIETQRHEPFEIEAKVPGKTITVYGLLSGEEYVVTDIQASLHSPDRGTMFNRIALVNKRWYFVGSDPLVFPMTQTERAKKMLRESKKPERSTCLEYKDIIIDLAKKKPGKVVYTPKEIKNKRKELIKKYEMLAAKYEAGVSAEKVIEFIYEEDYQTNHADFFTDLHDILKLPEVMPFEHTVLFNDMWNFFPHRELGGKAPAEKYAEYYGKL